MCILGNFLYQYNRLSDVHLMTVLVFGNFRNKKKNDTLITKFWNHEAH